MGGIVTDVGAEIADAQAQLRREVRRAAGVDEEAV
jgi:hypothetical protein